MGHLKKFQLSVFTIALFLAHTAIAGGSIAGKVTIVKGQVFITRGSEKIQVAKDTAVLESDVIESQAGGTARITMIDSNLVDVYPKSKIEIAKYVYKPNQDKKDVELKVEFGKVKSTVNQKYDGANNKFQVKTPSAVAGVRGTVFTAEYDLSKKVSRVITIEGLVAVTKLIDRERQAPPVFVRPDQVVEVDIGQANQQKPRDLKTEERNERKKEDKDLGYQYDTKKEALPTDTSVSPPRKEKETSIAIKEVPVQEIAIEKKKEIIEKEPIRSTLPVANNTTIKKQPAVLVSEELEPTKEPVKEVIVKEPIKNSVATGQLEVTKTAQDISAPVKEVVREVKEPVKEVVREVKEPVKEVVREVKEPVKEIMNRDLIKNTLDRSQSSVQEEQTKKQKQLEEEQARKQKQLEEEQSKKQKQLEEEQSKKQKQLEEEQAKKQKHLEEEMRKKEEEMKKRAEEDAAKKAELSKRLSDIAKQAEQTLRLPSSLLPKK